MKFGVCVPNYGATGSVEAVLSVATEAESLGYDSLWTTDHILMPKNSGTPYERILDSLSTLAYLAPQTKTVKLGISSLIVAMRNPVVIAKQLASIDAFSGGRVLLAMGAGWNEKEFSFLGSDFHTRGKRLDETIRVVRSLWRGETSFESKWIPQKFQDAVFEPRPASDRITIWIGGLSKAAMKRAAEAGDAWHPNALPLDRFKELVSQFRHVSPMAKDKAICVRIGLNCKTTQSEYVGAQGDHRIILSGDMEKNRQVMSELERLGVSYAVLAPSPDGKVAPRDQLESIRRFAKEFL
jgi:probable F420-dependent oxidoreductase